MRNKALKIRLNDQEFDHYNAACKVEKVDPAEKGRELVMAYTTKTLAQAMPESVAQVASSLPVLKSDGVLRVAEMFSGPGGIGIALNRAKSEHHSFTHAWSTDWDPDTCRTYKENVLKGQPGGCQSFCV